MKIIELRSENVKRIVSIEIHPGEDPVVMVSGENGAGKSSVLDSITMALGGKAFDPPEVIRRGEKNATVEIDLGDKSVDYTVKCRWTPSGRVLTVESKDGARYPSPQAFVDKLYGSLSFDPLAFMRLAPKEQADTVRRLVGVDTSALEAEHKLAYETRTAVSAKGKEMAAQFKAMPEPASDVPDEPVSISALLDEQAKLQTTKTANERLRTVLDNWKYGLSQDDLVVKAKEDAVKQAEAALETARMWLAKAQAEQAETMIGYKQAADAVQDLVDPDLTTIYKQISGAEAVNAAVAAKKARAELFAKLEAKRSEAVALDEKIEAVNAAKSKLIQAAKFPVAGMSFGPIGLTLNGLPLEQASSAEQLRVGMAMGLALNPKLRVVLIRDGSLLDNKSLKMVAEMAAEAKAQCWVERVSTGKIGFEIVEGSVASRDGVAVEKKAEAVLAISVPQDKPALSLVPPPPASAPIVLTEIQPDGSTKSTTIAKPGPTFKKRQIRDLTGPELSAAIVEVQAAIDAAPLAQKSTMHRAKLDELNSELQRRLDVAIDGGTKSESRQPGEEG